MALAMRSTSPAHYTGTVVWVLWTVASAAGAVAAEVVAVKEPIFGPLLVGAIFAAPQWALLRRHFSGMHWWVPLTTACALLSAIAATFLFYAVGALTAFVPQVAPARLIGIVLAILALGVPGTIIGFGQWGLLKSQVPQPQLWILASSVGIGVLVSALLFGPQSVYTAPVPTLLLTRLVARAGAGALYGVITGGVLVYLLRSRASVSSPSEEHTIGTKH